VARRSFRQVAKKVNGVFTDVVCWVDLASLRDPALVPQLIVHIMGLRPVANQPMTESLINFVRPKQVLLVLDNCEHLDEACAQVVRKLLTEAPKLSILAASREALTMAMPLPTAVGGQPSQIEIFSLAL
jgi:predicted ATPase